MRDSYYARKYGIHDFSFTSLQSPYLEKSIVSIQHYRVHNSSQLTLKRTCSLLYGIIPEVELVFRREIHEDLSWELPNSNAPSRPLASPNNLLRSVTLFRLY